MKSTPIRKPENDIMLAPGNAVLILIDYRPPQVSTVESIDRRTLINNIVAVTYSTPSPLQKFYRAVGNQDQKSSTNFFSQGSGNTLFSSLEG